MTIDATCASSSLDERVHHLLQRLRYKHLTTDASRQDAYRLRYHAYLREGAISEQETRLLTDEYDALANSLTFGLYIADKQVATIRLHVVSAAHERSPTCAAFSDVLHPLIESGEMLIDPTRFAIDHIAARDYPELPYAVLRLPFIAAGQFGAQRVLAAVRKEHMAFYARVLRCKLAGAPRPYLQLTKPLGLMIVDYPSEAPRVLSRYPFFAARGDEALRILPSLNWNGREPLAGDTRCG